MGIPLLKGAVDLSGYGHQVFRVVGRYRVQLMKVGGFKKGQSKQKKMVCLLVDPRAVVELDDRPEEEMDRLDGQTVVAQGRLILPMLDEPEEPMAM